MTILLKTRDGPACEVTHLNQHACQPRPQGRARDAPAYEGTAPYRPAR